MKSGPSPTPVHGGKDFSKEVKIQHLYSSFASRKILTIFILSGLLIFIAIIATSLGAASIGVKEVFFSILNKIFPAKYNRLAEVVVFEMRLPRILMAILAGIGLSVSGAVMQGILRNPLASPFTLGIASAASFGAALAIISGVGFAGWGKYLVVPNAFFFAIIAALAVYGLASFSKITSETMILAGIAIMYLFSALTSVLQYIGKREDVHAVVFWLMGNLNVATWGKTVIIASVFVISLPFLIKYAWDLNAMLSGDEVAISLGVNVKFVRIGGMMLATLVASSIISFTGTIGFVGLVSPHISRMIIGTDYRFLLPTSCVLGAILLLAADTTARTIIAPTEIPIGIMTSFIGIPFFLYLLMRKKRAYWK
jgi:iron complex transport system permease protein